MSCDYGAHSRDQVDEGEQLRPCFSMLDHVTTENSSIISILLTNLLYYNPRYISFMQYLKTCRVKNKCLKLRTELYYGEYECMLIESSMGGDTIVDFKRNRFNSQR